MVKILEAAMLILFGISWPVNILKSVKSRTAKGKSWLFLCFIFAGYLCGILKVALGGINFLIYLYSLNFIMVGVDLALYFRNNRLDKAADKAEFAEQINLNK